LFSYPDVIVEAGVVESVSHSDRRAALIIVPVALRGSGSDQLHQLCSECLEVDDLADARNDTGCDLAAEVAAHDRRRTHEQVPGLPQTARPGCVGLPWS